MKIVWAPLAADRASEIAVYLARESPEAASRWFRQVLSKVAPLRRFPNRGRQVPEMRRPDIREVVFPPYRILYRVEKEQIVILTIRHGRQLFRPEELH